MRRSVSPVPSEVKGMTVFNTAQVDTKKQPMFFGKPLGVQRYDSYKYGWKTSYYQNTHDMKTDEVEEPAHPMGWHDNVPEGKGKLDNLLSELENANEEECESCAI